MSLETITKQPTSQLSWPVSFISRMITCIWLFRPLTKPVHRRLRTAQHKAFQLKYERLHIFKDFVNTHHLGKHPTEGRHV